MRRLRKSIQMGLGLILGCALLAGCEAATNIVPLPLPDRIDGLTLQRIREIQVDATLDITEKRVLLREILGVADDAAGNRLVNFLLGLTIP
ncbi:MAG: hypothetical protein HUU22_10105 [Phycisphaerae bacterium]|nr:hypothetical protein [Phycisphaerae bacterium]NUQ46375.1 hypothetical protein [Phycisphaerae bacterium]